MAVGMTSYSSGYVAIQAILKRFQTQGARTVAGNWVATEVNFVGWIHLKLLHTFNTTE